MSATAIENLVIPEEIAKAVVLPASYGDVENAVYPACDWLRENLPIGLADVEGYDPVWIVANHADCKAVLADAEGFHNADVNIMLNPAEGDAYLRSILDGTTKVLQNLSYMEPPEHTKYRGATADPFQPNRIRPYEDRFRKLAKETVDRMMEHDGACDYVEVVSRDYPLSAVMQTLGVPESDYGLMLKLTQDTFGGDDPDWKRDDIELSPEAFAKQWHASVQDFYEYFEVIRKDRLANDRGDLATEIVNSRTEDGELMPERIQNHLTASIALAGHDTTNSALSGGMLGLARYPAQLEKVKQDPKLITGLVNESLRYATPAKHFMRNASEGKELSGVRMKAMDRVMCLFTSANFDEEVFEDPYRFDVTRRPNPHISFSFGPHVCLGQHLAKLEMRILMEELIPRLGTVELAGDPVFKQSNFVSGIKTLPIRFTKA